MGLPTLNTPTPNLGSLSTLPTTANALAGLVMVTPQGIVGYQPQPSPITDGLSPQPSDDAILFNYEGEQSALIECDITDHYIEDNSSIQDQIALRPVIISTHGYIGELNDIVPRALQPLVIAAQKVTILSGYAPSLSITALEALNTAKQAYTVAASLANSAVSALNTISNIANSSPNTQPQNKQQLAFAKFIGYVNQRTLFTVQTPWGIFINCAIKSLRAIQDADTELVTDFEVTFKGLRFSSTVIAGGVQKGQSYVNNYLAANSPTGLGTSLAANLGKKVSSLAQSIGVVS